MAKVEITRSLLSKIEKKFKKQAHDIIDLMASLEDNPKKGKAVGHVGSIIIKELKYKKFRFYFITNGFKVKFLKIQELNDLLLKFVRMSDKKTQDKVIAEIREVLKKFGSKGF